ncbi:MAG: glyoxalase [Pedobacter sp.]|nr:MAG: glyoxalase [Pedobacter sp.]
MHIDHATIRTNHLKETRDFMVSVFDLVEGKRPETIAALVDGYWLYWKDSPLVHIIKSPVGTVETPNNSTEAIDHFALIMEDYDAFKKKLIAMKIPFKLMDVPELKIKRIFLHTPQKILIETIFRD